MDRRLVYSRLTEDGWVHRYVSRKEAFRIEPPTCPLCGQRTERFILCEEWYMGWTGEFWCPRCNRQIGVVHYETGKEEGKWEK